MAQANLEGALLKLQRAEEHLAEIERLCGAVAKGKCSLIFEKDEKAQMWVQRVRITPKPDQRIALVAGDFLTCVRSSLDYLVSQLVILNGGTAGRSHQFPITNNAGEFAKALKRGQLSEASTSDVALIELLQPYHRGQDALRTLADLNNLDKHRELNVLAACVTQVTLQGMGALTLHMEGEQLYDGDIFGNIGVGFNIEERYPGTLDRLSKSNPNGPATFLVVFEKLREEDGTPSVSQVLSSILRTVTDRVFDAFRHRFPV